MMLLGADLLWFHDIYFWALSFLLFRPVSLFSIRSLNVCHIPYTPLLPINKYTKQDNVDIAEPLKKLSIQHNISKFSKMITDYRFPDPDAGSDENRASPTTRSPFLPSRISQTSA